MGILDEILNSPGLNSNLSPEEQAQCAADINKMGILKYLLGPRKSLEEMLKEDKEELKEIYTQLKRDAEGGFQRNAFDAEDAIKMRALLNDAEKTLDLFLTRISTFEKRDPELCAFAVYSATMLIDSIMAPKMFMLGKAFKYNGLTKENLASIRSQAETAEAELKRKKEKARQAGIKSGEARKTDADEYWGLDALRLAQTITAEIPSITQDNLADQIRQRWTLSMDLLPKSRSYIVEHIRRWEREGKLKRTR